MRITFYSYVTFVFNREFEKILTIKAGTYNGTLECRLSLCCIRKKGHCMTTTIRELETIYSH